MDGEALAAEEAVAELCGPDSDSEGGQDEGGGEGDYEHGAKLGRAGNRAVGPGSRRGGESPKEAEAKAATARAALGALGRSMLGKV